MLSIKMYYHLLKILTIIAVLIHHTCPARVPNFSCDTVSDFPFDVQKASGIWYENARTPPSAVPACVSATAPHAFEDNNYILNVNFRNNVNDGWTNTSEAYKFSSTDVQKGSFPITFGNQPNQAKFVYKVVNIDANYTLAAICVTNNAGLKIMSRYRQLNQETESKIMELINYFGIGNAVTWVEQNEEKCNAATVIYSSIALLAIAVLGVIKC